MAQKPRAAYHTAKLARYPLIDIDVQMARRFLTQYHYLKDRRFRHMAIYALHVPDVPDGIGGVIVFHSPSAPETVVGAFGLQRTEQQGIFELGRLAMHPSFNGSNYTSYFVGRSIRRLRAQMLPTTPVRAIISYADSGIGHIGGIYRATNAFYCGLSNQKYDFWVNGKIQQRGKTRGVDGEWKPRSRKHRWVWVFDETLGLRWQVTQLPSHLAS